MIRALAAVSILSLGAWIGLTVAGRPASPRGVDSSFPTPIRHVVIVFQENHSFDNVLGWLCVHDHRCNGAATGELPDGSTIPLAEAPDLVPPAEHTRRAMRVAENGGTMTGFANLRGCGAAAGYRCYSQFRPTQIPNLAALARRFAISDATFETTMNASWASHIQLAASNPDGFISGAFPGQSKVLGKGMGCDSRKDAWWQPPDRSHPAVLVPSCVPDRTGFGPYRSSPVAFEPTIMDRIDQAGLSWKLYAAHGPNVQGPGTGYTWSLCPTFAECLYGPQRRDFVASEDVIADARAGRLPSLSMVIPFPEQSQHNTRSMLEGDNWIGSVVGAIENGPDWSSTTIFITYDDCGCFYDHVRPPRNWGIREPMVVVGPYVKAGYTDSKPTSFNGMLAYIEHAFRLRPLSRADGRSYDYRSAFDYSQTPVRPVRMIQRAVPHWELEWLRKHPLGDDVT